MKKILTILCVLASFAASAQFPSVLNYTKVNSRYYWYGGAFEHFNLPGRGAADTALTTGQWRASGAVIVDTVNHVVYFRSGGAWRAVGADAGLVGGNLGTAYRLYSPGDKGVKTVSGGSGISIDSATSGQIGFKFGQDTSQAGNPTAFTNDRELNLGQKSIWIRRNNPGYGHDLFDEQNKGGLYFATKDTASDNVYDNTIIDHFWVNKETVWNTARRDYTGGAHFSNKHSITDSSVIWGVGGDFAYAVKGETMYTRPDNFTDKRVVTNSAANASINSTPINASPVFIAWTKVRRPPGTTASVRARGWYSGYTSLPLMSTADTMDRYVGFLSHLELSNASTRINKFYALYDYASYFTSNNRVDSAWTIYSPFGARNLFSGPTAFGGGLHAQGSGNSGPTDAIELSGNFKWFNPAINTDGTALMLVWDSVSKRLARAPIPSGGGGSTPTYEQVLTAGNSLSATAGIDYNTNEFVHSDIGNYIIENAGARKRININLSESRLASYSTDRFFRATDDSLFLGGVNFSADTTSHKPVWRNPVTGNLVYGYHPTGSGGSGWALTGNAATAGASTGSWLGTNNNVSLRIRTNDVERTVIDSLGRFNHYGTSNHGIRLKQGAQASATAGTFFNGLTLENSSSTAAYSWAYAGGGLLALNYFNGTSTYTNLAYFTSAGKLGLNNTSPTAYLHLPAGSATANTAPVKFTSGTLNTTYEAGAIEYNGNFFASNGVGRGMIEVNKTVLSNTGTASVSVNFNHWVFTGTTATWTLPTVADATNMKWYIKNRGSGTLTINSNAGGNDIYDAAAVNTLTVAAGASVVLFGDGTYINVH